MILSSIWYMYFLFYDLSMALICIFKKRGGGRFKYLISNTMEIVQTRDNIFFSFIDKLKRLKEMPHSGKNKKYISGLVRIKLFSQVLKSVLYNYSFIHND